MPIYEFHCKKCNTIYKFFSKAVNTEKIPNCPKCKTSKLKRVISLFSTTSGKKEEGEPGPDLPSIDERKMERAMAMLEKEAGTIKEDDPRQAASLMRKLFDAAGAPMGTGMEEVLRRLEAGEDPDKIEQEMGDLLGDADPFRMDAKEKRRQPSPKPKSDETLYEL
jgi:putative FmdB family regulatory protein